MDRFGKIISKIFRISIFGLSVLMIFYFPNPDYLKNFQKVIPQEANNNESCLIKNLPLSSAVFALGDPTTWFAMQDSDGDALPDAKELVYKTDLNNRDTDGDGYLDGDEVLHGYNPLVAGSGEDARLPKKIDVDLKEQRLRLFYGDYGEQGSFLISSGLKRTPTPKGDFVIQNKQPVKLYRGKGYYFPNTKWNLQFTDHIYIHGAYWHNDFGKPKSHGCINVSYKDMEGLYNWANVGTKVIIHD